MLPDHDRYDFYPIDERPPYAWPEGKSLAFYIGVNIEHYAFLTGGGMDPHNRGGGPTHRNFSWRDYGNRVGVWRIFDLLDESRLPATVLLNSLVAEHYPAIVRRIALRGDEILGHGVTNSQTLRNLSEEDEAEIIRNTTEVIERLTGVRPRGWLGPGATSNAVTPDLLKEHGYTHLLDWPADDQPFWMRTRAGPILSVPYPMELNDAGAQALRDHTGREFCAMVVDQFEEMMELSTRQPLVFALALHGYIVGQPHRTRNLRLALKHCLQPRFRERLWITRAGDIARYCMSLPAGVIPGS
jgi:hypothetical protein